MWVDWHRPKDGNITMWADPTDYQLRRHFGPLWDNNDTDVWCTI